MSVVDAREQRLAPDAACRSLRQTVFEDYAGDDALRWRNLAMLLLSEDHGWSIRALGRLFAINHGNVVRGIQKTKDDLQRLLAPQRTAA